MGSRYIGYRIKCGAIGNSLGNTLGTWQYVENASRMGLKTLGTWCEHIWSMLTLGKDIGVFIFKVALDFCGEGL